MATSAIPTVITALVSTITPLESVTVYDGSGDTRDPGNYLMVGWADPDQDDPSQDVAESTSQWANAGHISRDEDGTVDCAALSWNGDGDQAGARNAAFAVVAAVENALRSDPTIGTNPGVRAEVSSEQSLRQGVNNLGASALVLFKIHFLARI